MYTYIFLRGFLGPQSRWACGEGGRRRESGGIIFCRADPVTQLEFACTFFIFFVQYQSITDLCSHLAAWAALGGVAASHAGAAALRPAWGAHRKGTNGVSTNGVAANRGRIRQVALDK